MDLIYEPSLVMIFEEQEEEEMVPYGCAVEGALEQ